MCLCHMLVVLYKTCSKVVDSEAVIEDIWFINKVNRKDMSTGSVSQELLQTLF